MELSIDTASELASVALSHEGRLVEDLAWRCRRNHTVEVLPAIDRLLSQDGVNKRELTAVLVCTGPGMYTGLRVGVSIAQGLARGLGIPALGLGRLELDAYPHADFEGDIVAVHCAGRSELAWASYRVDPWQEVSAPKLSQPEELAAAIGGRTLVVGEVDEELAGLLEGLDVSVREPAAEGRARSLAELGFARLSAGETAEAALLRPVYLRPPAIGGKASAG
jgi:tRNA threonylcarbamoyladenosine biosynthesis protein TsaB